MAIHRGFMWRIIQAVRRAKQPAAVDRIDDISLHASGLSVPKQFVDKIAPAHRHLGQTSGGEEFHKNVIDHLT
jgi:hypothetical protein